MWIRPKLIREDKLANNLVGRLRVRVLAHVHFVRPRHCYVPASAGGETRASTAEKGRATVEAHAEELADLLMELSQAPYDENFPYV